jgi:hypothetical protein
MNSSLTGSTSDDSLCLYLEREIIIPIMKAPMAMDSPISADRPPCETKSHGEDEEDLGRILPSDEVHQAGHQGHAEDHAKLRNRIMPRIMFTVEPRAGVSRPATERPW